MQPDLSDVLQESFIGAHRELFQSSLLINVFSIPGRCPGLALANAFGINTGQQSDVGESSVSLLKYGSIGKAEPFRTSRG